MAEDLDQSPSTKPAKQPILRRLFRNPLTHLILALVVVSLVQGFIVKLNAVQSSSMQNTLQASERILVNRLSYVFGGPEPGDVITFTVPEDWRQAPPFTVDNPFEYAVRLFGEVTGIGPALSVTNVKRIVAVPGQTLTVGADGTILADREPLPSASTAIDTQPATGPANCANEEPCFEYVVPDGEYVVAGDNRLNSSDSLSNCRVEAVEGCIRTVPEGAIIGEVVFVLFPNPRVVS